MTLLPPFLPQSIRYAGTAFPDVEPFSIRAAASYEEIQYSLVTWIRDQLTPFLQDNSAGPIWDANAAALTAAVNTALSADEAQFANLYGDYLAAGSVLAPPPSGDHTGATDQAALQAILTAGNNLILQAGDYYITGLTAPAAATQPSIRGQGKNRTNLHVVGAGTGLRYRGPAGSVVFTGATWEGFTLKDGTGIAISIAGVGGIKWRQVRIDGPFSCGIQFAIEQTGDYTEFNSGELEATTALNGPAIEYKVAVLSGTPAGKSFNGSGLTEGSVLNQRYSASSPLILIDQYALPYNAPMSAQMFVRTPAQPAIQNNNQTDYVTFRGTLTLEQFTDGCVVAGAASTSWPVWFTGSLNLYGQTTFNAGAIRFVDRMFTPGASGYPVFLRRPWNNSKPLAAGATPVTSSMDQRCSYLVSMRILDGSGYEYDQLLYVTLRANASDGTGWVTTVATNRNADPGTKGAPAWSVASGQLVVTNANYTPSFVATYQVTPVNSWVPLP